MTTKLHRLTDASLPIKVLVVDDSKLAQRLITEILNDDPEVEVVGVAADPYEAREKIKQLHPDVITLDVEMPRMDGLTFLEKLMRLHPMPVVMISTLTNESAETTLNALELGAVDFISKADIYAAQRAGACVVEVTEKVKAAAGARSCARTLVPSATQKSRSGSSVPHAADVSSKHKSTEPKERHSADVILPRQAKPRPACSTDPIVLLGASTGGTEAINHVLRSMPADSPAILITQHIPVAFSAAFAERLDKCGEMTVVHAKDGDPVLQGHCYVAPGDQHLMLERKGSRYFCRLCDGPPVNRHKPAVDVLFRSGAQQAGGNALAVLLTGMGDDGAAGMAEILEAGGKSIAQDEASSVVWGMPGAAHKLGAVEKLVPLENVAGAILSRVKADRGAGTKDKGVRSQAH